MTELTRRKTAATAAAATTAVGATGTAAGTFSQYRVPANGRHHVRGGRWRVVGQQAAQAQAPEHGGRGRADPPAVPTPVPATPAAVRARVRGTPPARLVVADAVHAHVAVRPGPVAGHLRSGRGNGAVLPADHSRSRHCETSTG